MAEPIYTQGCPFCRAEVTLDGRTLKHAAPVCSRYRAWMDAGKEQHRQALAEGRAHELVSDGASAREPAWSELLMEVATIGLHGATPERLSRWTEDLERLGAPHLASVMRKQMLAGDAEAEGQVSKCSHGIARESCFVKCDYCGHQCSSHKPEVGCVEDDDVFDRQCTCDEFVD